MSKKQTLVVIGNGMVGHNFLESLVASDIKDNYEIVTFCEEVRPAYDRVHLTEFFSGKSAEDLSMVTEGFFEENNIKIHLDDKAVEIDTRNKFVTSAKGAAISYDKLVLATGSYPFVPPVSGHDRDNCFVYRTIEDLEAMTDAAKTAKTGAVIGGGLLGLEAAKALQDLKLKTHVVQFSPRLMSAQLDTGGAQMLSDKIEALGVSVLTGKNTTKIIDGDKCKHKLVFADGTELETDIVLFSTGIRPRDEIARSSGIEVGARGGIVIDDLCKTSEPDIYAIGECAVWKEQTFGLVAPGYSMARTVVADLAEQLIPFEGADMSTKLKLNGVDVASIGDAHAKTEGSLVYTYQNGADEIYKRLVVSNDKKKLLGAVLVGDASGYGTLLQYALNSIDLPEHPDTLIIPGRSDESVGLGPDALPASAQICSCFDVTKGQICSAVENGCSSMGQLKSETKAATGCGGCAALLKSVLDSELEKSGIAVSTDICEHFAHTRRDLYNIIMVEDIKSFDVLLEKHGNGGNGCEVCKQAVGSILASYWNDYILKQEHLSLQDTNDTFLANMQKDGTYSVVPRMTGGEVTPDGLIAVGQIAKKYKLYTKITGGQRVDLFGARVDQLPLIWEELIAAGFESGHAYGKSLRTVKSCVGSTWCRFGVDDSVGLAVELENRYKGLRAPHKIKFAVSGCTRECAEAQSKDIGVIATEGGWNLYVCGNGGMKPRHADLFATDLDKETLIKYIDRVLTFYVRSADRLQRTSVWMENMEGGLDYLKSIVIDDKLGICSSLEDQMQHVVENYQCEWKTTIADESKLKRFRTFINSEKTDDNILFVEERGQIRPANEDERKHAAVTEEV